MLEQTWVLATEPLLALVRAAEHRRGLVGLYPWSPNSVNCASCASDESYENYVSGDP